LLLIGPIWGEEAQWVGGRFPGESDDVAFFDGLARLTNFAGAPFAATARNVPAADLVFVPGSSLSAVRLFDTELQMQGGLLSLRGAGPGQLSILGRVSISSNGALAPSILTTGRGGELHFGSDSTVDGTLALRGLGRFVNASDSFMELRNNGGASPFPRTGSLNLAMEVAFVNQGRLRLDGQAGVSAAPSFPGAVVFENAAGGRIESEGTGAAAATLDVRVDNAGQIEVIDGRLLLLAGSRQGGTVAQPAQLTTAGPGARLQLLGEHRVTGPTLLGGGGAVEFGLPGQSGSLQVERDGHLTVSGSMFSSGPVRVQDGGTMRTVPGSFMVVSGPGPGIEVEAGGTLSLDGNLQLAAPLNNAGTVEVTAQVFGDGTASFVQQAGGRLNVARGASLDFWPCCGGTKGRFVQAGGDTVVNGLLKAGDVRFLAGTVGGSGTIEHDTLESSAVVFGPGLTVRPGNSPGELAIEGNLLATGALFEIEIAGLTAGVEFDRLLVSGDADFEGAALSFQFIGGYLPAVGDRFGWLQVGGEALGLETLTLSFSSDAGTVEGFIDESGQLFVSAVTPVPEPATWALWMSGLALAGFVAGRRTKPR
jgi:hypothetical protein